MNLNRQVKVSIGLPVYNGEKFIRNSIKSILSQTFADFELIISDNASTDATPHICEEYAVKDQRIKYFRQTEKVSILDNYLNVLKLAKGDCFMWVTHDDYYESDNYISSLYNRINEGFTFVFPNSNIVFLNKDGHVIDFKRDVYKGFHKSYGSPYEMSKDFIKVYGHFLYGMHLYGMFKTNRLRNLMIFFKKYSKVSAYCAEGSFLHKVLACEKSSFVENAYFNYVNHGKNESANIAPPKLLKYYLYYTYFIISIYLSSSFSALEKISLLIRITKVNSYKILWLTIFSLIYFYNGSVPW